MSGSLSLFGLALIIVLYSVEWADLPIVDFSKVDTSEGRAALVPQVCEAMRTFGFLMVINHGWTQTQVSHLLHDR